MKIIVLVKEVPDTYADRRLDLETGLADRADTDQVLDEIGERAVEAAVSVAESHSGTEVILLTMGPVSAAKSLRKGLAIGASRAVHILDDALAGADLTITAEVLAKAIAHHGFDLVIAGNESTDGAGGVIPAMIAEWLGVPHATGLDALDIDGETIHAQRRAEGGTLRLAAQLPLVASITEQLPDPRVPNLKGIMSSKRKPIETVSLADLGVQLAGDHKPRSVMIAVSERPPRLNGTRIADDGTAADQIADFLTKHQLI